MGQRGEKEGGRMGNQGCTAIGLDVVVDELRGIVPCEHLPNRSHVTQSVSLVS
jgi:hypothetical protein